MKFSCDPSVWGRPAWTFLHSIALCYPVNPAPIDRQRYQLFFLTLPYVLPCVSCQEHLLRYLSDHHRSFERAFDNRLTLSMFVMDLHNFVNRRLNKSIVPYHKVIGRYDTQLLHPFAAHEEYRPSGNGNTYKRGRS